VGLFGVVLAAIEAFSHTLAAELGPRGIRVACPRSTGSPESPGEQEAFAHHVEAADGTPEEFQASLEQHDAPPTDDTGRSRRHGSLHRFRSGKRDHRDRSQPHLWLGHRLRAA
jgi:NAD(P)-dependent dehydrogenase (short-subunit alcohol dehydrogenase family)